ncbi:hypothetical protein BsWGS_22972 [Bradybaena similaris]
MKYLRVCSCLVFIVGLRAYELSQNLVEFYCVFNGNYSDREQVARDGSTRTIIEARLQPVVAPALWEVPVLYAEESIDGVLVRAFIFLVTEEQGDIIYIRAYNFTGNTDIRPGTFDASQIKSLTWADLHGQQDCQTALERVEAFVFAGSSTNCKQPPVNGQRSRYGSTDTCGQFIVVMPAAGPEKATLVPYKLTLQADKYELENAPINYYCDCNNTRY